MEIIVFIDDSIKKAFKQKINIKVLKTLYRIREISQIISLANEIFFFLRIKINTYML